MTSSPFQNVAELEDCLSAPSPETVEAISRLEGDLLVLGVGGKMGPSLARMAKRALVAAGRKSRVIGVARFSSGSLEAALQEHEVETIRCDLLDSDALRRLPAAPNILYLAGMKFGATGQEPLTWAMNVWLPAAVCQRFPRSRIVAFSTGNVYGLVPADGPGSRETDPLVPVGEYAMSCVGRERMFEHFGRVQNTPAAILRLNYACDLRYGVLVDLAEKVASGEPVDLGMGWFNTIWQGDANNFTLRCFAHTACPPTVLNLTGPEKLSVRQVCLELGQLLGREPRFIGSESAGALLSDASRAIKAFGQPSVDASILLRWVAGWIAAGQPTLRKPTHFGALDGKF